MNPHKKKIVVAMSGGVDSSVSACQLHEQGHEVVGLFMRTGVQEGQSGSHDRHRGCCSAADAADARWVAGQLGIRFYSLNLEEGFSNIIDYFVDEYRKGRTPNPCVMCNHHLKFGKLWDIARAMDADYIATGHHAQIGLHRGQKAIRRAADGQKDQSYVLFGLDRNLLDRILFPIGHLTKSEIRREAERFKLEVANKPDSVDICFVPNRDYSSVLKERDPTLFKKGNIVNEKGEVLGQHEGVSNYTIGQRRGLGIAVGLPVYVTQLDTASNTVTLGTKTELMKTTLYADRVNWQTPCPGVEFRCQAQIRYSHTAAWSTVTCLEDNRVRIQFDDPQPAITPGQAVVLYEQDYCLGGGWISHTDADNSNGCANPDIP